MENKVLIKLIVPELDGTYDVFIPVNEVVWKLKKMLVKSISDLTGVSLDVSKDYALINKTTSVPYGNNKIVIDTDIRNATELILLSVKDNNSAKFGTPGGTRPLSD